MHNDAAAKHSGLWKWVDFAPDGMCRAWLLKHAHVLTHAHVFFFIFTTGYLCVIIYFCCYFCLLFFFIFLLIFK